MKKFRFYIGNLPEAELNILVNTLKKCLFQVIGFSSSKGWCVFVDKVVKNYYKSKFLQKFLETIKKIKEEHPEKLEKLSKRQIRHLLKNYYFEGKARKISFEEKDIEEIIKEIDKTVLHELIHYVGKVTHEFLIENLTPYEALGVIKNFKLYVKKTIISYDFLIKKKVIGKITNPEEALEFLEKHKNSSLMIDLLFKSGSPRYKIVESLYHDRLGRIRMLMGNVSMRDVRDGIYKIAERIIEELYEE